MTLKRISLSIIVFIIVAVNFISCNSDKKIETEIFDKAIINNLDIDENVKWIVILPGLGCMGCIKEAELFMKDNVGNQEIIFVLTKLSSLKILQQKTGINIYNHFNIFIDTENAFDIPTDNSIYPCLIKMKEGKIVTYEFQSPKNGNNFNELVIQINNSVDEK